MLPQYIKFISSCVHPLLLVVSLCPSLYKLFCVNRHSSQIQARQVAHMHAVLTSPLGEGIITNCPHFCCVG